MNRSKNLRSSGPTAEQLIEEMLGSIQRVFRIAKVHFFIECVTVKPMQQALAVRGDYGHLRVVDMCIDEARKDYLSCVLVNSDTVIEFANQLLGIAKFADSPIFYLEEAVLKKLIAPCNTVFRIR